MEWLILLAGLIVGGVAAWFLGKAQAKDSIGIVKQQIAQKDEEIIRLRELYDNERVAHAGLKSRTEEIERNIEAQKTFLAESQDTLANAFSALSKDALNSNNRMFLDLAKSNLETLVTEAKGDLGKRQQAIDNLLKPLNEALKKYDQQVQRLAEAVQKDYGSVDQHLKTVASTAESLQKETGNLVQALRAPQVRGRWGELALRRVVELAGMTRYCDFEEQVSLESEGGRTRPDVVVNLPGGRNVVIDSKVPIVAYLDAVAATNEDERSGHLARHARHIRDHMKKLGAKSYWDQFRNSPDFVVMFIPAESFFSAALEVDHSLVEDGMRNKVILSSPTTLLALLRAVEMGWRQEQMAENAMRISDLGAEIHDRISKFVEHFARVGRSLERATEAYNASVGTLESRVLVSARRFKELGVTAQDDVPSIKQVERMTRTVDADPLPPDENPAV